MQKRIVISIASIVIIGLTLSLFGMTLAPQVASAEKNNLQKRETPRPIPATNIELVKKVPLPLEIEAVKGGPAPSGAASGILGATSTGAKYAIVIGICDYPGTKNDICKSDGDSYNMYQVLTGKYGYSPSNIYWFRDMGGTTEYATPTWSNILTAVMEIKKVATTNDEVVFFFSGHGAKGTAKDDDPEETDEAIVVHNNDSSGLDFIWDGELRSWFSDFGTQRIVFIFDSCLAGGMNDVAASGRVISMATGETQSAYVFSTGELGEGVFSHYFVNEGMLQIKADGYNRLKVKDGEVAVEESFDYTKVEIPLHHPYLKQRQKPVISDKFADDLLL